MEPTTKYGEFRYAVLVTSGAWLNLMTDGGFELGPYMHVVASITRRPL
jgi:hypothetical protein